jgi:hypothetical protein
MNGAYYLTILMLSNGNPYGFYIPYDSLEACEVAAIEARKSPHGTHAYCSAKGAPPAAAEPVKAQAQEPLRPQIKHRALRPGSRRLRLLRCRYRGYCRTFAVNEKMFY